MDYETFKNNLRQELSTIEQRHTVYSNEGQRFTHWILENVFLLSDSDARAANYDGPNDGGLDGFYIDENENLVRIVQCKYSESIERADRESFTTLPHRLRDPEKVAESYPRIYDCSTQYRDCLNNNYDTYLSFVFIGENRSEYTDELQSLLLNTLPEEQKGRFVIEVIGIDELITKYLSKNPFGIDIPESEVLRYSGDDIISYETEAIKAKVLTVKGSDLAAFGNSPRMFLANFRYFLDLRNRVNSKISETIQDSDERDKVWNYNNGITIVCDRFDNPDNQTKNIKLYRPQIVNGCQTVSILNRPVVNRYANETYFLVRIIATRDDQLKAKIATYTNSQTKVTDRTLRSNDPIQKSLQHQFSNWDPPYFFDCKDGEWSALAPEQQARFRVSGRIYRRILNSDCAKAHLAFHGKPVDAKSNPRLVWDLGSRGFYTTVFPNERKAEELLLSYLLMESFNEQIDQILNTLGDNPTGEEGLKKEYLGHCDTTLLALAGYILRKYLREDFSIDNLKLLIQNIGSFEEGLFARCEAAIRYEVARAKNEADERNELFNARNFFLRLGTLSNMKNKIDADIDLLGESDFYQRCGLSPR
ncbi:hypothetical protein ES703_06548 [subsurface metagenome]